MTQKETIEAIKDIPLGAQVQIIKKSGTILDARLASHEVNGIEKKDYGNLVVPELPPAIIVQARVRFGNFRVDIDDILKIAWVGDYQE
jgi:hypothetical protein